jgi:preprotein translocase subunit SecA
MFKRDVDYLVKDGKVVIVDEFTGRMMEGRRWSDGLHQAVEAKEKVNIERENQTLATITFQNYFRMYDKLSGMTGTAETESTEFGQIYNLDVVVVPTNRPMIRDDRADLIYRTADEKWQAVVEEIQHCHNTGQPVLVGTVSIETSEKLSKLLKRQRVPHVVLNAKYHDREASIVAQAGRRGAVTLATNMAGRGTDIVLGGNPEIMAAAEADPDTKPEEYAEALKEAEAKCHGARDEILELGGLHILGTERHESRRIDNQLRGRSGRQGDPGSSRFFLSLEDDLMRIFGSDRVRGLIGVGMQEGEPLENRMVSRAIEKAQTQVENRNFEIRKHLLEYDDVMNRQREEIYRLRRSILESTDDSHEFIETTSQDLVEFLVTRHCPEKSDPRDWNLDELATEFSAYFDVDLQEEGLELSELGIDELKAELHRLVAEKYQEKVDEYGEDVIHALEQQVLLRVVDTSWKDHLLALDHLKEGIGLRGYGQRDPLNEYKRESFELFEAMRERIEDTVIKTVYRMEPVSREEMIERERRRREQVRAAMRFSASGSGGAPAAPKQVVRGGDKVGRNDPCPCGSGKKYKKCHGAPSAAHAG